MLTQDTVTTGIMTPIKTDDTVFKLASGVIGSLLQPFQKTWTQKGKLTFKPNKLELQHMKVDVEEYPDDIEATWLGFLASENLSRKEWPFVRYMIEKYIFPKIREEFELSAVYYGVQKDPETGVAGAAADVMNGIHKLLQDGVAAGTINQVTGIGTLAADTIFDQVEAFHDGISQIYQGVPMDICMSPTWAKAYLRDKRSNGFYTINGAGEIDYSIDFTPHKVRPLPSMAGSGDLWATPKANIIHLQKKTINKNKVNIEELKRQIFVATDWWEGIGFGINEIVWTTVGAASGSASA